MGQSLSRLRKLRGRSLHELLTRGRQAISAWREQLPGWEGIAANEVPRLRWGAVQTGSLHSLPAAQSDLDAFAAGCRTRWAEASERVIDRARRAAAGRFDILGYQDLSFGSPIDWHLDPIRFKRASAEHWSRVPYLDAERVGDHKIIWELNRHQHFVTFGQAFRMTRDEVFAEAFVRQLRSWCAANPPKVGINWASSLEVGLRAIAWLHALHLLHGAAALTEEVVGEAERFLYLHGSHIEAYLSTYFSPNTHLTGEALGLLYLGTYLEDSTVARRWKALGWMILQNELTRQVRRDGVYFEQSTWYHRYTTDFYLHAVLLARGGGLPVQPAQDRLGPLAEHLLYLMRPDGTTPLFGDDDGGSLLSLNRLNGSDLRDTLGLAAVVLKRPDFCWNAGDCAFTAGWLLGQSAVETLDQLGIDRPAAVSHAFVDSGYYAMRDNWDTNGSLLVFDGGPQGALTGGHAHADALGFDLTVQGVPMLVDPGTFSYVGVEREWFRSTSAHNTVTLDGQSSSIPVAPFRWERFAPAHVDVWISHPRFDIVRGYHEGYQILPEPAVLSRIVVFAKGYGWVIVDQIESEGPHRVQQRFHAAPRVQVRRASSQAIVLETSGVAAGTLTVSAWGTGTFNVEDGWVSTAYGAREPGAVLSYDVAGPGGGAVTIVTALIPGDCDVTLEAVPVEDGRGWRIVAPTFRGTLVLPKPGFTARVGRLEAATGLAWLHEGPEGVPEAVCAWGEGTLVVDGAVIPGRSDRPWRSAIWHGASLVLEA